MKMSDKIKYMVIGAAIALIGFGFGSLIGGIDAHDDTTHFDSIVVKNIIATEFIAVGKAKEASVVIGTNEKGGTINISNKGGEHLVRLGIGYGGTIIVKSDEGEGEIRLIGNQYDGGAMTAESNDGKGIMSLSAGNGFISVWNEAGQVILEAENLGVGGDGGAVFVSGKDGIRRQLATMK